MNVLFVDQFSELGGAQQCLLETLAAARRRGWRACLAVPGSGPLIDRAAALGATVENIPCGAWKSPRFALDAAMQTAELRRCARGVDLVYVNGPRVLPAAAAAARAPLLFHCHSRVPAPASWLVRAALRFSRARVIASCRFVGEPFAPHAVVYNGVAGPDAMFTREPRSGPWRIGLIGRIAPEKGQAEFLAAARLLAGNEERCQFALYGDVLFGPPAYLARVRRLARDLPVEFAGWRSRVYHALAALDLVVVPSGPREGTTRVILEAYAAGVPVVAFASGGISEIVEDGRTGFLVHRRTPEALAQVIRELIHDPGRLRRTAIAGLRHWRERFTLERYQREVLEQMERAARGRESRPGTPPPRPRSEPAGSQSG